MEIKRYISSMGKIYDTEDKNFDNWYQIKGNDLYALVIPYGDERDLDRDDYIYFNKIDETSDDIKDFIKNGDLVKYNGREKIAEANIKNYTLYFNSHYVEWNTDVIDEIYRYNKINIAYELIYKRKKEE